MAAVLTLSILRDELHEQQAIFQQIVVELGARVRREVREDLRMWFGGSTSDREMLRSSTGHPTTASEDLAEGAMGPRVAVQNCKPFAKLRDATTAMEVAAQPTAELPPFLGNTVFSTLQASPRTIKVTAVQRADEGAAVEMPPLDLASPEPLAHQALPGQAQERQPRPRTPGINMGAARLKKQASLDIADTSPTYVATGSLDEVFPNNLRLPAPVRRASRCHSRDSRDSVSSCETNQSNHSTAPTSEDSSMQTPAETTGRKSSLLGIDMRAYSDAAKWILRHPYFDIVVAMLIVLNGVSIGVQTDVMARNVSEELPFTFRVVEICFCVAFTAELVLRLSVERLQFFKGPEWGWNSFDFVVVMLQLVEEGLGLVATITHSDSYMESSNFGFVRMIRALRLIRIIRLVRVLRLIGELRTIVMSIASSMKHLFWTLVLLLLMIYICSVPLTQIVLDERLGRLDADLSELVICWDSIGRSSLTLFEAIFGGIDWDVAVTPLVNHVHMIFAPIFCLYICFALLALMNVVTGVFVENAIDGANRDKEKYLVQIAHDLFDKADLDRNGMITWAEFEKQLDNPDLKAYFEGLGVDSVGAKSLFRLLDMDNSGAIDTDEWLTGTLRLRGDAKAIDLAALIYESRRMSRRMQRHAMAVDAKLAQMSSQMGRMCPPGGRGEKGSNVDQTLC